jgi:hypothetical protein
LNFGIEFDFSASRVFQIAIELAEVFRQFRLESMKAVIDRGR